jgi:hypothetical protein
MAKKENLEFLLNSYFGSGRTIETCAKRAYGDLGRTLSGMSKMSDEKKRAYRSAVHKFISDSIESLLKANVTSQKAFDEWHGKACSGIIKISEKHKLPLNNGFTYGLAQKWLNMTLKYMLVMEQWNAQSDPIKKYFHVPVDSYIMQAASEDFKINLSHRSGGERKYSTDSKGWSKWDESEYTAFQVSLRKATKPKSPIEWEFPAWLRIKNKREQL